MPTGSVISSSAATESPLAVALEQASERDLGRLRHLGVGNVERFLEAGRTPAPWLVRTITSELGSRSS